MSANDRDDIFKRKLPGAQAISEMDLSCDFWVTPMPTMGRPLVKTAARTELPQVPALSTTDLLGIASCSRDYPQPSTSYEIPQPLLSPPPRYEQFPTSTTAFPSLSSTMSVFSQTPTQVFPARRPSSDSSMSPPSPGTAATLLKYRTPCRFCLSNASPPSYANTHSLRDPVSDILVCPVLQRYVCDICGATGLDAHTRSYCPYAHGDLRVNYSKIVKTPRNSTGLRGLPAHLQRSNNS